MQVTEIQARLRSRTILEAYRIGHDLIVVTLGRCVGPTIRAVEPGFAISLPRYNVPFVAVEYTTASGSTQARGEEEQISMAATSGFRSMFRYLWLRLRGGATRLVMCCFHLVLSIRGRGIGADTEHREGCVLCVLDI